VPFLMAYTALIDGPFVDAIPVVISAVLGIYLLSAGISGYLRRATAWYEQVVLIAGGVLLIAPGIVTNLIGLGLGLAIYVLQRLRPGRPSGDRAPAEGSLA
jgi:TRAP-type uncharacterized transport system fused permease subunit